MQMIERDDAIEVVAARYRLRVERHRPRAQLADAAGTAWTALSLLASVDRTDGPDETLPGVTLTRDGCRLIMELPSSIWQRKLIMMDCRDDRLEVGVEVTGTGSITDVTLAGGTAILASGACGTFRSSIETPSLFVPTPTQPVAVVRPTSAAAVITVVGDAEPGRLHGIFSPVRSPSLSGGRRRPRRPRSRTDRGSRCGYGVPSTRRPSSRSGTSPRTVAGCSGCRIRDTRRSIRPGSPRRW